METILIIEDDSTMLRGLKDNFEYAGYNVITAQNGKQALECLEEEEFDLAIVDMQMPEMTGIDVVKITKLGDGINSNIPFVILTANVTLEAKLACDAANVDAYLTKPIDMLMLLNTIEDLIGKDEDAIELEEVVNSDTQSSPEGEMLNQSVLDQLSALGNHPDFIEKLIDHFQFDTDNLINSMHFSLRGERYQKLIDEAHGVKGAAGNIGAVKLAETAKLINRASPDQLKVDGAQLLRQLKKDFNDTMRVMRSYQKSKLE